jgi:hypothetical protein
MVLPSGATIGTVLKVDSHFWFAKLAGGRGATSSARRAVVVAVVVVAVVRLPSSAAVVHPASLPAASGGRLTNCRGAGAG